MAPNRSKDKATPVVFAEDIGEATAQTGNGDSYWNMPEAFRKTLSTASLTGLVKGNKATIDDNANMKDLNDSSSVGNSSDAPSEGGYWEMKESFHKTLSTVSLTGLMKGNKATIDEDKQQH
mmetsp:Transcript_15027/g.21743  ORF Transcript_15027/g.21743 Transcript_15027/m.21743 type:complete len:121 (-) Transcript_15027:201-563(-)|eukprot:CAMPEP_0202478478 /NCGR_PEP_ID=MMETSP1360-20130828/94479_1 /ASSEMBLY_ACC=CAM_ASM_000848 /TAXON_ID=515479 /ORGANISM="Licmophora paradoxa, Strain CCMP2313" /LENGTH=120 /DNA_ID=CAMNT_0049105757 /DNA_START=98 /DNA_END=460 /DNA_ORIENTATION=-